MVRPELSVVVSTSVSIHYGMWVMRNSLRTPVRVVVLPLLSVVTNTVVVGGGNPVTTLLVTVPWAFVSVVVPKTISKVWLRRRVDKFTNSPRYHGQLASSACLCRDGWKVLCKIDSPIGDTTEVKTLIETSPVILGSIIHVCNILIAVINYDIGVAT